MERPPEPDDLSRTERMGAAIRGVAVDLTPLRVSRDFRILWFGHLVSEAGYQFTIVAMFVQVYRLTGSAAAVGLIGLAQIGPLLVSSIAAGAIVDAVDRRKLLALTQVAFALSSSVLLAGAIAGHPPVWLIYAAAGLTAAIQGIASPTGSAMIPRMVGRELLASAASLNQLVWNATAVVGPALAGIVIAHGGFPWAYGIDVVTYGATFAAAMLISPMPPLPDESGERPPSGIAAIREGFAYLRGRRVLQSTFAIDLVAMIFGLPRAIFPILAMTQFDRGPAVVGFLFAAPGVGAFMAALTSGWVGGVRHQGRAVVWAVVVWGSAVAAFGLVGANLWIALVLLAVAGAADVISAIYRSTILQMSVPDALRGRLSAIHILVVTGGPRLGDFEAGVVAQAFSPTVSVVSGGLLCVAGAALLAWLVPEFRRYHAGGET